jgi:hypothetical protein
LPPVSNFYNLHIRGFAFRPLAAMEGDFTTNVIVFFIFIVEQSLNPAAIW